MVLMRALSFTVPVLCMLALLAPFSRTAAQSNSTSGTTGTTGTTATTGTTGTTGTTTTTTTATTPALTSTVVTGAVAVFRLTFEQTGDSINYRPYQGGYYIAPLEGGSGSLVLTLVTGTQKQYFAYEAFGEVFVAVKGKEKRMVLSATATNTVSTTVFYAIGKTDTDLEVEGRNAISKVKVAEKMVGYAVSADSEQDLPFSGATTNSVGVAGVSVLTARLDETLTQNAIRDDKDVATELDVLIAVLEGAGYVNGQPQTAAAGNTGTATTTGTATQGN